MAVTFDTNQIELVSDGANNIKRIIIIVDTSLANWDAVAYQVVYNIVVLSELHVCISGRSPAVVIGYLMKSRGWRLTQSYQWVKERRPAVELSEGMKIGSIKFVFSSQYLLMVYKR